MKSNHTARTRPTTFFAIFRLISSVALLISPFMSAPSPLLAQGESTTAEPVCLYPPCIRRGGEGTGPSGGTGTCPRCNPREIAAGLLETMEVSALRGGELIIEFNDLESSIPIEINLYRFDPETEEITTLENGWQAQAEPNEQVVIGHFDEEYPGGQYLVQACAVGLCSDDPNDLPNDPGDALIALEPFSFSPLVSIEEVDVTEDALSALAAHFTVDMALSNPASVGFSWEINGQPMTVTTDPLQSFGQYYQEYDWQNNVVTLYSPGGRFHKWANDYAPALLPLIYGNETPVPITVGAFLVEAAANGFVEDSIDFELTGTPTRTVTCPRC